MSATLPPLPTMIVGSLPQPDWLIDRDRLGHQFPPRVRAAELWRIPPEFLQEAQDDATLAAIRVAGGGRARRPHRRRDPPGVLLQPLRDGARGPRPRPPGHGAQPLGDRHPGAAGDRRAPPAGAGAGRGRPLPARAHRPGDQDHGARARSRWRSRRRTTTTADDRALALAYADVVREEIADLFAAGADIVQIDEPWLQARPEVARRYGAEAVTRALDGRRRTGARAPVLRLRRDGRRAPGGLLVPARARRHAGRHDLGRDGAVAPRPATLRPLRGKGIALGVLDLSTPEVETPETVADRVRRALDHVDVDRLVLSSDCGLKYLPRASAAGKMRALAEAAAVLRSEL